VPLILPLVSFVDLSDEVLERVILVQISASVFFGLQPGRKFFHRSSSGSRFAAPSRWFGAVPISQSGAKAPSLGVARFSSAGLILRFCVLVAGLELRWRPPVRLCPSSVSQPRECAVQIRGKGLAWDFAARIILLVLPPIEFLSRRRFFVSVLATWENDFCLDSVTTWLSEIFFLVQRTGLRS
jgi:hypothetical protein